jgi:hypothetical protein
LLLITVPPSVPVQLGRMIETVVVSERRAGAGAAGAADSSLPHRVVVC